MTLTEEQFRTIAAHPEGLRIVDPTTNRAYVLLPAEVADRVSQLLAGHPHDAYPAIDRAFAEGWNAPGMDDYDRYEEFRK